MQRSSRWGSLPPAPILHSANASERRWRRSSHAPALQLPSSHQQHSCATPQIRAHAQMNRNGRKRRSLRTGGARVSVTESLPQSPGRVILGNEQNEAGTAAFS